MKADPELRRQATAQAHLIHMTNLVWIFFCIWTAVAFVVMPFEIGETWVRENMPLPQLIEPAVRLIQWGDAIWMVLAALNVYLFMVMHLGINTARMWAVIIIVLTGGIEIIGETTGFPFGPYKYTDNLGGRLFGILPFTIPLAWMVVIVGARFLVLKIFPAWTRWKVSLGVGFLALLTDLNLEFIAWKIRAYWIWYPGWDLPLPTWPPLQNYVSWFVIATLVCAILPEPRRQPSARAAWRPILVFLLINLLFLTVHLVLFVRYGWIG